jgi:hypothetical protein
LNGPNDIKIFPFICLYVVPVYEQLTGKTNTLQEMEKQFERLMKRKMEKDGNG